MNTNEFMKIHEGFMNEIIKQKFVSTVLLHILLSHKKYTILKSCSVFLFKKGKEKIYKLSNLRGNQVIYTTKKREFLCLSECAFTFVYLWVMAKKIYRVQKSEKWDEDSPRQVLTIPMLIFFIFFIYNYLRQQ